MQQKCGRTKMIYYLLTIVDDIKSVSAILAFFAFIATVTTGIIRAVNIEESISDIRYNCWHVKKDTLRRKLYATLNKISITIFAVTLSLAIFLPTSKGIAFIYVAPKLIENDNVKETFANIPELAKLGTDYLKELLKEKVNNAEQGNNNS